MSPGSVVFFFRGKARAKFGCLCALAIATAATPSTSAFAQGFGANKKTIALTRKLPALIHLSGTAINIQSAAGEQANAEVAQTLSDLLLVTLQRNDSRLHEDKNAADVTVKCKVITYETPPPKTYVKQQTEYVNKRWVQVPVQFYKITGELTVAYQVTDAHKNTLDAGTITKKYAQDFQAGTNQAAGGSGGGESDSSNGSVLSKIDVFHRKKEEVDMGPPNPIELRQKLVQGVVAQLAPRLVNTQETIEVMLPKGKPFDEPNKLADKAQWTRCMEALETMTPLSKPEDDAYRVYEVGVANEAMAYQAEDKASIQKFLDEAAIDYGKAIDAKPSEKYFIDPQNRIETAVEHYRKLAQGADTKPESSPKTETASNDTPSVKAASNSTADRDGGAAKGGSGASGSKAASSSSSTKAHNSASKPAGSTTNPGATKATASKSTSPALTNADIIKMAKAGMDEDSIIAAIENASSVNFDFSTDSLIALSNAGAKVKIQNAMRARARKSQSHVAASGAN